ncbi:unnamed protein product [Thelazia callipaeda]|uniref:GRIP domain-containing protein n=1 Tax=Thelazia callipaeda TaxID=103827 RepID=A0A0N5D065_THECL|nr:unnamed protein product [Thelazia callipaeda]
MNSWLRNIQGHLSEFASEVLSEAIEEVNDPESELQVAKKKISEMEKELTAQQGIVQQLEKKINNFEDDLYAKNLEVDTLNARYSSAIESRDSQIRSLQAELEQMHHASPEAYSDADDDGLFLASGARLARMKDEIEQLRKEVAHWKRFVNEQPKESDAKKISELERILVEQKTKYEDEVAALVAAHKATVDELKFNQEECQVNGLTEEYDSEIAALKEEIRSLSEERNLLLTKIKLEQEENAVQEDQVDILTFQALDKVLSERYGRIENEYAMLKEKLDNAQKEVADKGLAFNHSISGVQLRHVVLEIISNLGSIAVIVEIENLQQTINEMRISEISLKDEKRNQELMMAETIRQLKMEIKNWEQKFEISEKKSNEQLSQANQKLFTLETRNNEFATAFGELNAEFQNYKADHDSLATSNHLLLTRIDTLEAVLTLYEKQYKMCKAENASTVDRPVKLSDEFEKLRMSFDISKSNNELDVIDEVDMLRTELEASKRDRERLRDGVEHFRLAVVSVEDELNGLRESNNKLTKENKAMSVSLDEFKGIRNMLETSGSELKILREKFSQLQDEHKLKEKQWREQLLELSEIRDDAKRQLEERQRETSLRQIRSADATLPAEMVESKSDEGKTASSEGTADSNNGWEKVFLMDWDVTTVGLSSSSFMNNSTIANQLREALAAGAEKSEECEELRRQNCEMNKKAKELKHQNLQLEQIISATEQKLAELQGQLEISESNRKKDELKNMEEINSLQHAVGNYEQKIKQQKEAHEEALHRTQSQHKYEIQDLEMKETKKSIEMVYKKDVERATIRQNELERKNRELQQKLDETATQLEELERVGAEHISKLQKLELQCSDYKMQLQNVSCELEQLSLTAAAATERALCLDRDLKNSTKSREKVMRDCERLRSHLMNVEETSVKEAKSAEEREMELRKRIRTLEQKAEESVDNIIESTSAYKRQISELTEELNLIRNEKQTITERLRERENALADTKMALSNLQNVLRDIAIDHEGQMAQHQNTTTELKKNIDDLKREMYELRQTQVTMEQEKQLLENRTEQLKEEVCKKDMLIEELETSLDERAQAVKPSTSSHIVDDQVLRQLFLSYFTADKDKQPEIAVLLASVLGYSQEDVAKINSAVNSSSRGWFSFGSSSKPQPSISLAEQFVRFLEKESAVTPHSLPVQVGSLTFTCLISAHFCTALTKF